MDNVELPRPIRMACLARLGEMAQIPAPRNGKRTTEALGLYANDIEVVNRFVLRLLDPLAGFQCEPEDRSAAREELIADAKEALAESEAWLAQRKQEGWT